MKDTELRILLQTHDIEGPKETPEYINLQRLIARLEFEVATLRCQQRTSDVIDRLARCNDSLDVLHYQRFQMLSK